MLFFFFFFFKQKTAYEIRKGDWSSDVCSSDLTPGTTIQASGPSISRSSVSSWPDATTPRSPAASANRPRRSASNPRSGTPRPTTRSKSPASWEVRTVTPTSAISPAACAAAASTAGPPSVWTVARATSCARAASTAPATTLGMSCHLRSRNTRTPRAVNSRTNAGPSRTCSMGPILAQRRPGSRAASSSASRPLGRSNATISSATAEFPRHALRDARIGEGGGADRHERRARGEVLARVARRTDPPYPDDRDGDRRADFARSQHPYREQRRTADAPRPVPQSPVQRARDRIHQGNGIRPFLFCHPRHARDVGEYRGELHRDGASGNRAAAAHQLAQALGCRAELEPAGLGVGARRIDLERGDHREVRESRDHALVVLHRAAGDVHQDTRAPRRCREPGELVLPHGLEARVRESYGVQHSARELGDARRGVPAARLRRDCFGDDSPQGFEIDHTGHLVPETGGAGSEEDGILEGDAEQPDRRERHRLLAGAATARLRSSSSK